MTERTARQITDTVDGLSGKQQLFPAVNGATALQAARRKLCDTQTTRPSSRRILCDSHHPKAHISTISKLCDLRTTNTFLWFLRAELALDQSQRKGRHQTTANIERTSQSVRGSHGNGFAPRHLCVSKTTTASPPVISLGHFRGGQGGRVLAGVHVSARLGMLGGPTKLCRACGRPARRSLLRKGG